jgi:hypothetical protein
MCAALAWREHCKLERPAQGVGRACSLDEPASRGFRFLCIGGGLFHGLGMTAWHMPFQFACMRMHVHSVTCCWTAQTGNIVEIWFILEV